MRYPLFIGTLVAGPSGGIAFGQAFPSALGSVRLTHAVIADGKPLAAGLYQIRISMNVGRHPLAYRSIEVLVGQSDHLYVFDVSFGAVRESRNKPFPVLLRGCRTQGPG